MSEPQIDIRPDHWAIVRDILQRHVPQYAVWAFGSRAKWTAKEYSDLDLAIITDSPLPLATSAALAEEFSESDLPWKVDIVDWAETSETFRKIIERDRVVVQGVWAEVPLSELTSTPATYGVVQPGKNTLDGVPMLRVNNFQNDSVNLTDVMRIAPEIEAKYERTRIQAGDVLLTIVGSVGQVAVVSEDLAGWNIARAVAMIRPKSAGLSRWISFALRSPQAQHQLGVTANTTVQTTINLKDLRELKIPFPEEKERRAITQILGSLDDKIELNRRMNETLEAMVRSLFKSWFVDFDTVPTEDIQESELGLIPKGWRVAPLSSILEIIGGGTPKTSVAKYWNGDIPWFSVVDTPAVSDLFVITTEKSISQSGLEESSVRLISKGTTIISARGTVGNLALAARDMTFNQSCYGLKGKQGIGDYFVFLTAQRMVDQLRSMAHGSVFSTITRQTFDAIRIAIPPLALFKKFEKDVSVWFDKILNNVQQTQELIQLRDTLLPKLISGEVRVKDAEKLMESIV